MVAQIITIVNQSGKVIKSSKTLVNVLADAKLVYNEKKADIKARRQQKEGEGRRADEARVQRQLDSLTLVEDGRSVRSSSDVSRIRRKPVPTRRDAHPMERGLSDGSHRSEKQPTRPRVPSRQSSVQGSGSREPRSGELIRRHTDMDQVMTRTRQRRPTRSASMDDIDMDLAYGELPPSMPLARAQNAAELRQKMTTLQKLLDEANCVQHTAIATIEKLSKNPDTMAAVALTLAEISALASKLAPGALTALKGSFPAVMALLASPQFAIAAGVGIGITIIAFGSYKIIKKIQARKEDERMLLAYGDEEGSVDELREIDRIDYWRRGIADVESGSVGTSVDGEFITPTATRTLIEEGKLSEADLKSKTSSRRSKKTRSKTGDGKARKAKSSVRSSSALKKETAPSGLRMLFKRSS